MLNWFERRLNPFPDAPVTSPPEPLGAFVGHFLKPAWPIMALVMVLSATIAAFEVAVFSTIGTLVDWLATEPREGFFERNGTLLAVLLVGLALLIPALHLLWELVFHQSFMGNFPMRVRWQAHRYLLEQSLSFFQDDMSGRISSTMMQTALSVRETVTKFGDVLVYFCVYVTSTIVLLAGVDLILAAPMLVWLVTYGLTLFYFIPRLGTIAESQADARAQMTGRIVDSYANIQTVKLFAHAKAEADYARASMEPFLDTVYRQMRLVTVLNTLLHLQNFTMLASLTGLGIWLWQIEAVSVGSVAVAMALAMRLQGFSQWILWETAALFEALGTTRDGAKLLAKPLTVTDAPDAVPLLANGGAITFDDVHFSYGGRSKGALNGFSLTIEPGERIGIVGRSGAGKSTLVNLLLRLHDLGEGKILIDGLDIARVTQTSLRAQIGVVTQDTALLHRSVADNIRYGSPDASDAAVERAAQLAHADGFIAELIDAKGRRGFAAHVGERGVKLSGGQRQRIAIARVFLKNPPILVLDEATSALDSEVEAAIHENLHHLVKGKTVLAVAHRLSTIAAMDRLVVIDQGTVVEQGTHAELVARGGIYADLWSRQAGGFLADQGPARPSLSMAASED
jgi:ATP-binding cassette subfamily B multidrug efflux pump